MDNKVQIDYLDCRYKSYSKWFWAMIGCAILSVGLDVLVGFNDDNSSSINLLNIIIPALTIPGVIYNLIFAQSCRQVSETLTKYWKYLTLCIFVVDLIITIGGALVKGDETAELKMTGLSLAILPMYACTVIYICRNYTGVLGGLGKYMWLVPLIGFAVIGFDILMIAALQTTKAYIYAAGAALYFIYLFCVKLLKKQYDLLKVGYAVLSDDDNKVIDPYEEDKKSLKIIGIACLGCAVVVGVLSYYIPIYAEKKSLRRGEGKDAPDRDSI